MKNNMFTQVICKSILAVTLLLVVLAESVSAEETVLAYTSKASHVLIGTPDILQIAANHPFTVEGWMYFNELRDMEYPREILYTKGYGAISYILGFVGQGRTSNLMSAYGGSGWLGNFPVALSIHTWYHLAFSFDGTDLSFYLNGEFLGSCPFAFNNNPAHSVRFGGYDGNSSIEGNLSEVRVWDHARTAQQVTDYQNFRLTGGEAGLLGYWPLNEGSGSVAFDQSGNNSTGTVVSATWATSSALNLLLFDSSFSPTAAFTLANIETGSERFTNSNKVNVTSFPLPEGADQYQITQSGDVSSIDTNAWELTTTIPAQLSFTTPDTDTNMTFYAWFTNSVSEAILCRAEGTIFYTRVQPVPVVRVAFTRGGLSGSNVVVYAADLDMGSTGGFANETVLAIAERVALVAEPGDDQTPGAPYVTLSVGDDYPLLLELKNEAGNAITATATCTVSVVEYNGTNTWSGGGYSDEWHDGVNWIAGVPTAGQDVVMASGSLRLAAATAELASFEMIGGSLIFSDWSSRLNATNVTISGGSVTGSSDFDATSPSNRVWIVCEESFYLVKPGTIDVSGKGYTSNSGPGVGVASAHGTGSGHGGQGGFAYKRGGATYGSLTAPVTPGSGGTPNGVDPGGSGGGVVRIIAGNTVSINGTISANGLRPAWSAGGGAGGSIYLTATQVTGDANGRLQASGGSAGWEELGGGGGGGRIAIDGGHVAAPLAIRFSTAPGRGDKDGEDNENSAAIKPLEPHQAWTAGWGTLYIEDESLLSAMPQNNQFDRVVLRVGDATAWNVPQLTVTNNSFRLIPEGFQLNVTGDLTVGANAHLGVEGSIACGGNLVLTNGARLSVFSGPAGGSIYGAFVDVTNDIVISEGAWLQPNSHTTDGGSVRLRMRNLRIIGTTGGINAMARGYAPRQGEGMGGGTGYYGGGGGYGGVGGKGAYGVGGAVYGNPYAPIAPGSGGGGSWDGAPLFTGSGYGGGLIRVEATQNVFVEGQIIADGGIGTTHYLYGAGGAGGGIFISCNRFLGTDTALLSVKGGKSFDAGGGGGGRIAVWHNSMPTHLQDKLLSGMTGTAITSTNNPASYLGQVNVGFGTGGNLVAQSGTIWFISPPPSATMILVR